MEAELDDDVVPRCPECGYSGAQIVPTTKVDNWECPCGCTWAATVVHQQAL